MSYNRYIPSNHIEFIHSVNYAKIMQSLYLLVDNLMVEVYNIPFVEVDYSFEQEVALPWVTWAAVLVCCRTSHCRVCTDILLTICYYLNLCCFLAKL